MEISQDECRRWVERATTQAANASALFDEAKRLQKENAALRAEVERLQERFDAVRDAAHAEAKRVFPATVIESHIGGELHADDLCSMLAAEVERLREALRRIGVALDTYDAASEWWKNDSDAFQSGNRLACFVREAYDDVTLPAPPVEEE